MKHAHIVDSVPVLYTDKFARDAQGVQTPLRGLDKAGKKARGIYEVIIDLGVPDGYRRTGTELVLENDEVYERATTELAWPDYTSARLAVVQWIDNLTAQIEAKYPSAVQKRWEVEEAAARAVKADIVNGTSLATAHQLALVTDEGAAKGRTPEEHADAIIANANKFREIADEVNKLFLATDYALENAASPDDYVGIFENAKAQAAPLAQAYGLEV